MADQSKIQTGQPSAGTDGLPISADPAPSSDPTTARRMLLGGSIGTFVEWYDFLVYGLTAPLLATLFFPGSDPTLALLATLAIFGVSFFMRPLGGVIFGYFGDKHGRIKVLSLTILLMGGSTALIGLLPTYATWGIAAPILLLACRLLQGLSVGGEHSGSMIYVLESAPEGRRSRWVSYVYAASYLPNVVMGLLILGLRIGLGDEAYNSWAWRLPFLFGAVLACVGLWLRMRLRDPDIYKKAVATAPKENPIRATFTHNLGPFFNVLGLVAPQLIAAYLLITYMYTFLTQTVRMAPTAALISTAATSLVVTLLIPIGGRLADRVGRRPLMLAGLIWLGAAAYPALLLVEQGSIVSALAGQILLGIGVVIFVPACLTTMLELFRTSERYSGHAMAQGLGAAIFGGTTPLIAALLVAQFGPMAPAFYVIASAVFGLIVLFFTPETRQVDLLVGVSRTRTK